MVTSPGPRLPRRQCFGAGQRDAGNRQHGTGLGSFGEVGKELRDSWQGRNILI